MAVSKYVVLEEVSTQFTEVSAADYTETSQIFQGVNSITGDTIGPVNKAENYVVGTAGEGKYWVAYDQYSYETRWLPPHTDFVAAGPSQFVILPVCGFSKATKLETIIGGGNVPLVPEWLKFSLASLGALAALFSRGRALSGLVATYGAGIGGLNLIDPPDPNYAVEYIPTFQPAPIVQQTRRSRKLWQTKLILLPAWGSTSSPTFRQCTSL